MCVCVCVSGQWWRCCTGAMQDRRLCSSVVWCYYSSLWLSSAWLAWWRTSPLLHSPPPSASECTSPCCRLCKRLMMGTPSSEQIYFNAENVSFPSLLSESFEKCWLLHLLNDSWAINLWAVFFLKLNLFPENPKHLPTRVKASCLIHTTYCLHYITLHNSLEVEQSFPLKRTA